MDEYCFVCGEKNERGMKIKFRYENNEAVAEYKVPEYFQGYENIIHGGIISTLLDEVMAKIILFNNITALTRKIEVEFLKPLTVNSHIVIRGKINEKRKKLIKTTSEISANGETIARAKALFFEIEK